MINILPWPKVSVTFRRARAAGGSSPPSPPPPARRRRRSAARARARPAPATAPRARPAARRSGGGGGVAAGGRGGGRAEREAAADVDAGERLRLHGVRARALLSVDVVEERRLVRQLDEVRLRRLDELVEHLLALADGRRVGGAAHLALAQLAVRRHVEPLRRHVLLALEEVGEVAEPRVRRVGDAELQNSLRPWTRRSITSGRIRPKRFFFGIGGALPTWRSSFARKSSHSRYRRKTCHCGCPLLRTVMT